MRARIIKRVVRNAELFKRYGLRRASGSRARRRGRRSILRALPGFRDWSNLPTDEQLRLLVRALDRLDAKRGLLR